MNDMCVDAFVISDLLLFVDCICIYIRHLTIQLTIPKGGETPLTIAESKGHAMIANMISTEIEKRKIKKRNAQAEEKDRLRQEVLRLFESRTFQFII
jgi:hypothetical protein